MDSSNARLPSLQLVLWNWLLKRQRREVLTGANIEPKSPMLKPHGLMASAEAGFAKIPKIPAAKRISFVISRSYGEEKREKNL